MLRLRTLLAGLVAAALSGAGLVAGQGNCVTPDFGCTELTMASPVGQSIPEITVTLYVYFEANTLQVCDLAAGSTIGTGGGNGFAISDVVGTFSGSVVPVDSSNAVLQSIELTFQATQSTTNTLGHGTIHTPSGASLQTGGLTVNFPPLTGTTGIATLGSAFINSCTAVRGDPLFSGFKGQQFFISGVDGQVLNILSTFNMQLNGRLAQLEQGSAMVPDKQEEMRLRSAAAHLEDPAVPAFPATVPWSHPGTYFSEAGVALLDDHRLYVKAGPYSHGWAKATLDGRPLTVSDNLIALGQGVNTTYIARISAHQVMVRTVNVEYTLTNSDNFLNVDRVHLEKGVKQHANFKGILGNTVDAKWNWEPNTEKDNTIESGNLFEQGVVEL